MFIYKCTVCNYILPNEQIQTCPNRINHPVDSAFYVVPLAERKEEGSDMWRSKPLIKSFTFWINAVPALLTLAIEQSTLWSENWVKYLVFTQAAVNILVRYYHTERAIRGIFQRPDFK